MHIPVPFFEIIEQQRVNVLKHTYPWLLSVRTKTYLQGALTFFPAHSQTRKSTLFLDFDSDQVDKDDMFVSDQWQKALGFGQH